MAWAHIRYYEITNDPLARLAELRLHVIEVTESIQNPASYSIDGNTFQSHDLPVYLRGLKKELEQLEAQLGVGAPSRNIFYRGIPG